MAKTEISDEVAMTDPDRVWAKLLQMMSCASEVVRGEMFSLDDAATIRLVASVAEDPSRYLGDEDFNLGAVTGRAREIANRIESLARPTPEGDEDG